mgnify:CR=1 FL=1
MIVVLILLAMQIWWSAAHAMEHQVWMAELPVKMNILRSLHWMIQWIWLVFPYRFWDCKSRTSTKHCHVLLIGCNKLHGARQRVDVSCWFLMSNLLKQFVYNNQERYRRFASICLPWNLLRHFGVNFLAEKLAIWAVQWSGVIHLSLILGASSWVSAISDAALLNVL